VLVPGRLRLALDATGTHVDTAHDVDPAQYERDPVTGQPRPVQAARHEVALTVVELSLFGSLALRDWLALELRVPYRIVRSDATFRDDQGNELDFESIHHRDETLTGIGDIEIWDRFRVLGETATAKSTLDLRLGAALPTGNIVDDPYLLGAQGKQHQHVFFGGGTLDPIAGADFWQRFSGVTLNAFTTVRAPFYQNARDYRAGARGTLGAALQSGLGLSRWTFVAGLELYHERPAKWASGADVLENEATDQGRTSLIPGLGVVFAPSPDVQLRAFLKRPFSTTPSDAELEIPFVATLGAEIGFQAYSDGEGGHAHFEGDGHDHGHADDEHWIEDLERGAAGRADVSDLATGGRSFELDGAKEPGKITVIDFWAEWCEPCHAIDRMLRALAARHDNLAVRRVEIVDLESPAAVEHLPGVKGLPVVWIFDERGRRVETLVGTDARSVYERLKKRLETP
jgi:thioredoxin 1